MGYLFEMFSVSLALTLVLELPVCMFFGMRAPKALLLVILVNILTNPAAVLLCWLGVPQLPVEIGVIFAEAGIYIWFANDFDRPVRHPGWMAVTANVLSWTVGMMIGGIL